VQEYRYGNIYERVKIIYALSNSRFVPRLKCFCQCGIYGS